MGFSVGSAPLFAFLLFSRCEFRTLIRIETENCSFLFWFWCLEFDLNVDLFPLFLMQLGIIL